MTQFPLLVDDIVARSSSTYQFGGLSLLEVKRTYFELSERDPESMHPVSELVLGSDNELVSDLQEVLCIEGYLWAQSTGGIDPCDLNELLVNILFDDPI